MPPTFTDQSLILALDIGSSSVRAIVCNRHGQTFNDIFVQEHYQAETTPDGGSFIDPETLIALVIRCIDSALQKLGSDRIEAVVIDTFVSNLIGVNNGGKAITPLYTWADQRGSRFVEEWHRRLAMGGIPSQDYIHRTGCQIHTSYWPVRLLWLEQTELDTLRQVKHWLSLGDYLYFRLFGTRPISISAASWTGLFNRHTLQWDTDLLDALSLSVEQLSQPTSEPFQVESQWSALKDSWWFPAVADGAASNIGAGCTSPSHIALSVGTSAAMRILVANTPNTIPDGLFAYRVDNRHSLIGGALSNAGNLYYWLSQVTRVPQNYELESAIKDVAPDSHGLTILPFLAGERAPGWNPDAKAAFVGMTLNTKPEHLLRASLEAVAYRVALVAERLKPYLPNDAVCVANGAAILNSPTWLQIMADVLKLPVYAAAEQETTIRGVVYMATSHMPVPTLAQLYEPNPAHHATYKLGMQRQQELYQRLLG